MFPIIYGSYGLNKTMLILAVFPIIGVVVTTLIRWEPVGKDLEYEDQYIEKV